VEGKEGNGMFISTRFERIIHSQIIGAEFGDNLNGNSK
jgi:hypothetical protein